LPKLSEIGKHKTKYCHLAYNMGMHLTTPEIIDLLFKFRYAILFPVAFLEGPAVAVVAGFMIAIGFMSFIPAYLILISANILGDIVYYFIGRLTPRKKLDKALMFFRINDKSIKRAEELFVKNRKKAIIFGKIAHAVGSVFLITAGIVKIPLNEYLKLGTLIELPKALIFLMIGYYLGHSVSNLGKVVDYSIIGFILVTIILIVIGHLVSKYADKQIENPDIK